MYRAVSKRKLNSIVERLQRSTVATTASRHDYDNQNSHIAYIRRGDSRALSASSRASSSRGSVSNASSFNEMVERITRPTTASSAARHDFDAQNCHIDYLSKTLDNYPPPKRVVNDEELSKIAENLITPTAASKAARHDFDAQREHVTYLEKIDPKYPGHKKYGYRRKTAPFIDVLDSEQLDKMVGRFGRPTTASSAARHDFDTQKSHIDYLSKTLKNYPPPKRVVDDEELSQIAEKLTHPTAASKAWRHDFDAQREHVTYLEKIDPKYPGHKKYGYRRKTAPFMDVVDPGILGEMVERWCKPTVASQGGEPLQNKDFTYMKPPPSKTCPEVKGLSLKFRGKNKLSSQQLAESVSRLSTPFKRFANDTRSRG